MILTLFASVGIKFLSASVCGLILLGILPWAPICFLTCRLSSDVVIFWQVFFLKSVLLVVRQMWFQYDGPPARCGEGELEVYPCTGTEALCRP